MEYQKEYRIYDWEYTIIYIIFEICNRIEYNMEYPLLYQWNIVEYHEISWDTMGIYRLVVEHNHGKLAIFRCFTH